MAASKLDQLPNELLISICLELDSLHDLYSLVRVSKQCNIVLSADQNKKRILTSLIQRSIPSEIMPDAYAACKAPRFTASTGASPPPSKIAGGEIKSTKETSRDQVDQFLAQYQKPWREGDFELDLVTLKNLCRLSMIVDNFITSYVSSALQCLREYSSHRGKIDKGIAFRQDLSRTERGRLQRAFFRFESVRKLSGSRTLTPDWVTDLCETVPLMSLFGGFEIWEQVEISLVYYYLTTDIEHQLSQSENELMEDSHHKTLRTDITHENAYTCNESLVSESKGSVPKVSNILDRFTDAMRVLQHSNRTDNLVSLGLPFLRAFSHENQGQKLHLAALSNQGIRIPRPLNLLRSSPYPHPEVPTSQHDVDYPERFTDTLHNPSKGWIWRNWDHWSDIDVANEHGIVCLGTIFWDEDRLEAMELMGVHRWLLVISHCGPPSEGQPHVYRHGSYARLVLDHSQDQIEDAVSQEELRAFVEGTEYA